MASVVCVRVIWDRQEYWSLPVIRYTTTDGANHAIRFTPVHLGPEAGWPMGRKGLALAGAWGQLNRGGDVADGMLVLDADVAIDPQMVITMMTAIGTDPAAVWTAPVRIWPVSTMKDHWIWAHWNLVPSQHVDQSARWFSFNFTYLPRQLLEHCLKPGRLKTWTYPNTDSSVARAARELGIPGNVVADCWPVHLHW